jgi:hypothetical protein
MARCRTAVQGAAGNIDISKKIEYSVLYVVSYSTVCTWYIDTLYSVNSSFIRIPSSRE